MADVESLSADAAPQPHPSIGRRETHEVFNQAPDLVDYNPFDADRALAEALEREGGGWSRDDVRALGRSVGSAEVQDWARLANQHAPQLRSHDRVGRRTDVVEFHPAYHALMSLAFGAGVHAYAWSANGRPGAHVARAALSFLWNQADNGVGCPTGMAIRPFQCLRRRPPLAGGGTQRSRRMTTTRGGCR